MTVPPSCLHEGSCLSSKSLHRRAEKMSSSLSTAHFPSQNGLHTTPPPDSLHLSLGVLPVLQELWRRRGAASSLQAAHCPSHPSENKPHPIITCYNTTAVSLGSYHPSPPPVSSTSNPCPLQGEEVAPPHDLHQRVPPKEETPSSRASHVAVQLASL